MKYYKLSLHEESGHSIPYIVYLTSDSEVNRVSSSGLGKFSKLSNTLEKITKKEFDKAMPKFKGEGVGSCSSS